MGDAQDVRDVDDVCYVDEICRKNDFGTFFFEKTFAGTFGKNRVSTHIFIGGQFWTWTLGCALEKKGCIVCIFKSSI